MSILLSLRVILLVCVCIPSLVICYRVSDVTFEDVNERINVLSHNFG